MMTQKNWYSRIAGALFLLAFIGGVSAAMLGELNVSIDLAADFAAKKDVVMQASVGLMVMGFACAGISVALYPVLKEHHPASAMGAVIFRGIEGIFHLLIPICYLLMSVVAQQFPAAEANRILPVMLETMQVYVFVATIAWGIGAMLYYGAFYQSRMIPRFLSVWGVIGMPLAVISAVCVYFLKMNDASAIPLALNLPIALQELVMAIWLIVKGVRVND